MPLVKIASGEGKPKLTLFPFLSEERKIYQYSTLYLCNEQINLTLLPNKMVIGTAEISIDAFHSVKRSIECMISPQ